MGAIAIGASKEAISGFTHSAHKMILLKKRGAVGFMPIVVCIIGVSMDPFFLYIPFLSDTKMRLGMDANLWKVAFALRSFADVPYFFRFISALLILRGSITAQSIFRICVYFLAVIPIPQFIFYDEKMILKTLGGYTFWDLSLFIQCVTRLTLIFPLCEQLKTRVSVTTRIWVYSLANLVFYINVAHVIGATWCYLSLKRQLSCWHHVCKIDGIYLDAHQSQIFERTRFLKRILQSFSWGLRNLMSSASNLQTSTDEGETFFVMMIAVVTVTLIICLPNFQRYAELASERSERIADKMKLIKPRLKLLVKYHNLNECTENLIMDHFQNALENDINSFNLERLHINPFFNDGTSTESLFEDLGFLETRILNPKKLNIQGKAEKWLSDNNIPSYRNNILFYLTCGLKDDQDVNLTGVLSVLPYESKWMTMKDLCFDTLKKMSGLQNIDEKWFRRMSSKLKPRIYSVGSDISQEGQPLNSIIFITYGIAWIYKTGSGSSNSLQKGDFYGEELLQWKSDKRRELGLDRIPLSGIPLSTTNVKCHTQVEALVLTTEDVASCSDFPVAASQLRRIIRKLMIVNAFICKRIANSAADRADSSSRTEEGASVQMDIEMV